MRRRWGGSGAPILQLLDALERERWARTVADESLASFVVVGGGDAHRAVDVKAVVRRGEALLLALVGVVAIRFSRREGFAEERAACEREPREGIDGRGRAGGSLLRSSAGRSSR
jgi:hypothetical protein